MKSRKRNKANPAVHTAGFFYISVAIRQDMCYTEKNSSPEEMYELRNHQKL